MSQESLDFYCFLPFLVSACSVFAVLFFATRKVIRNMNTKKQEEL